MKEKFTIIDGVEFSPKEKAGKPPKCGVCGEPIPRQDGEANYMWLNRRVCNPKTDTKEVKCMSIRSRVYAERKKAAGITSAPHHKKVVAKAPERKKEKRSDEEIARLNHEQAEINKAIAKKTGAFVPLRNYWMLSGATV